MMPMTACRPQKVLLPAPVNMHCALLPCQSIARGPCWMWLCMLWAQASWPDCLCLQAIAAMGEEGLL